MSEDFFSPNTWEAFNQKVLRVGELAGSLLGLSNALQARSGLALTVILAEFPEFAPALLGGVSRDGAYGGSSLAKAFLDLFGASIETNRYCSLKRMPGEDAEAGVSLQVKSTHGDFQTLLRSARAMSETGLEAWERGLSSKLPREGNGESYLHQPAKAVEDVQAFLQALADVSVGVDERATFLWMTRRITWRYLTASFPQAAVAKGLEFLKQRMGLEPLWEPNPNPEEGYTLWGYPDYRGWNRDDSRQRVNPVTYAASVLGLSQLAWLVFSGEVGSASTGYNLASAVFASPPELPKVFQERAQGQLARVKRPACPFPYENLGEGVQITGPLAASYWYSKRGNRNQTEPVSVYTVLDWLIPSVCYGERELGIERGEFRIQAIRR